MINFINSIPHAKAGVSNIRLRDPNQSGKDSNPVPLDSFGNCRQRHRHMAIDAIFVFCTVYHRNFTEGRGGLIYCVSIPQYPLCTWINFFLFTSLSHTDRFPSSISLPCRKTKMYFWNWTLFFLYQNVSRFKCAIKLAHLNLDTW